MAPPSPLGEGKPGVQDAAFYNPFPTNYTVSVIRSGLNLSAAEFEHIRNRFTEILEDADLLQKGSKHAKVKRAQDTALAAEKATIQRPANCPQKWFDRAMNGIVNITKNNTGRRTQPPYKEDLGNSSPVPLIGRPTNTAWSSNLQQPSSLDIGALVIRAQRARGLAANRHLYVVAAELFHDLISGNDGPFTALNLSWEKFQEALKEDAGFSDLTEGLFYQVDESERLSIRTARSWRAAVTTCLKQGGTEIRFEIDTLDIGKHSSAL